MQRIRVSLLLVSENRLLFVRETAEARIADIDIDPDRIGFWQLPGGGLEAGESLYECAIREAREETGLEVEPDRIVYVQEYVNPFEPFFQIEFIVAARAITGHPHVTHEDAITGLAYLSSADRPGYNLAPWHDRDVIWSDLERAFPRFRHLGIERVQDAESPRLHSLPFGTRSETR